MENQEETKVCKICGEIKPIQEFSRRSEAGRYVYRNPCKACSCERSRQWRLNNPERVKEANKVWSNENKSAKSAYNKEYREKNREHLLASSKEYWSNHRESLLKRKHSKYHEDIEESRSKKRQYYSDNRDRIRSYQNNSESVREYRKRYARNNPHIIRQISSKRRAYTVRATPLWANRDEIIKFYEKAVQATNETGLPYHVDHIVPLNSTIVCGLHNEFNLQILPASENISKGNRYWPDMPDPE